MEYLLQVENRAEAVKKIRDAFYGLAKALDEYVEAYDKIAEFEPFLEKWGLKEAVEKMANGSVEIPTVEQPTTEEPPMPRHSPAQPKGYRIRLYEEILAEKGPLHVTRVVEEAERRGLRFTAKKLPREQVRASFLGSKRFQNFGGNVWGLIEQAPPPVTNGRTREAARTH